MVLEGIKAKPELNGTFATVIGPLGSDGRVPISISSTGQNITVKPENLRRASGDADGSQPMKVSAEEQAQALQQVRHGRAGLCSELHTDRKRGRVQRSVCGFASPHSSERSGTVKARVLPYTSFGIGLWARTRSLFLPAASSHLGDWSSASTDLSSRIKSMKDIKTVITSTQLNNAAKYLHAQKKQTGEVHEELALELASSKSEHSQASKMAKLDRDKRITFQNSSLNTTEVPTRLCSKKAGSAQRVLSESHVNKLMVRF